VSGVRAKEEQRERLMTDDLRDPHWPADAPCGSTLRLAEERSEHQHQSEDTSRCCQTLTNIVGVGLALQVVPLLPAREEGPRVQAKRAGRLARITHLYLRQAFCVLTTDSLIFRSTRSSRM
jgi:hypothetical protein